MRPCSFSRKFDSRMTEIYHTKTNGMEELEDILVGKLGSEYNWNICGGHMPYLVGTGKAILFAAFVVACLTHPPIHAASSQCYYGPDDILDCYHTRAFSIARSCPMDGIQSTWFS